MVIPPLSGRKRAGQGGGKLSVGRVRKETGEEKWTPRPTNPLSIRMCRIYTVFRKTIMSDAYRLSTMKIKQIVLLASDNVVDKQCGL
jgi:hypothetical protein